MLLLHTKFLGKCVWTDPRGASDFAHVASNTSSQTSFPIQGLFPILSGWETPMGASRPYTHLPPPETFRALSKEPCTLFPWLPESLVHIWAPAPPPRAAWVQACVSWASLGLSLLHSR